MTWKREHNYLGISENPMKPTILGSNVAHETSSPAIPSTIQKLNVIADYLEKMELKVALVV